MDKAKKVVLSFLNTAEGYFHTKSVVEKMVKQPRDLYGPKSDRPERWDHTDVRDLKKDDIKKILGLAKESLDKDLFKINKDIALNSALQFSIHTLDNGRYQSKINSALYNILLDILGKKGSGGKKWNFISLMGKK